MAVPDQDGAADAHDLTDGFLESSHLTYIIPFATQFSPEEALQQGQGNFESKLAGIEQRDRLFFDETVDVYLILRTQCASEDVLRFHLRRLVITLDAQIVNSMSPDIHSPPASEFIYNGAVENIEDAFLVEDEGQDGSRFVYAVWKTSVFLCRPRIRLQLPTAVFSAAANIKPAEFEQLSGPKNGYMQSCAPSGMNLLDAFAGDPMLGGIKPQLSAQRVSRVAPATQSKDALRRINGLQNLKLKIFPILHTRVKFSRPNTSPPSAALIALLETDFTPYFDCEVLLERIAINVTDGSVEDLNDESGMRLPLSCVAHDHLTFMYKLTPCQLDILTKNPSHDLIITIEILILVRPEGEGEPNPCTPRLSMTWTTNLDFTLPVNPGFGQPITTPIQRSHRPSQLSISGGVDSQPLVSPSVTRPDALPSLEAAHARSTTETSLPDFGITLTFTGPPGPVYVGEEFVWTVFVVNRSHPSSVVITPGGGNHHQAAAVAVAGQSRKLMLMVVPQRRRNEVRTAIRTHSTAAGGGNSGGTKHDQLIAEAVLDETVVHSMQRSSSVVDVAEVVCLSADVRVGPLAPNACAVVELRFLTLKEGVVGVEAVKVVDLGSQEHVDVRELPLVVVQRRREDSQE
ncbi:TRAPP trafficking subunit Trs65-domain-containing protein [Podospora australis]|uniref:TRAPP trafficking subunit Trs65-domain-containing protein n=1 Tax=Podospora australis TaxID=1536484 RepID=A0AAN7AKY6_9PEZI|nr:TRAPP trafficking subunit Trs65-domain-containing protein [Podospora australis]